jgi:hypothetical protein
MKKLLFILYFTIIALEVIAESGDGSAANPFYGTISTTVQWSVGSPIYGSTVYVGIIGNTDLTVGTGGHLTINPGITVIFTQLTSDLFITGTGQLTAGGSGTQVTFTKDPLKSHWGHMSFQSMSGTPASSTIDNCIFEYGYSIGTSAQPLLAGGALQIDFNNVTVSNCIFRNNFAYYAGAVMIASNRNTIVTKSRFESNSVDECGGGMIIYSNATALIENCIFSYNYSKGKSSATYSGGAIWSYTNSSKIINCTFVENTSDRAGDGIYSYNSSGMRIINSILWGSNDQFAGASTTSTIVTCAFETTKPANAVNSIVISALADDHFNNAGAGDWSLKYISPCRDAGTTPTPTVPTDYLGNSRIGTYDIGAYEVQYCVWTGNTDGTWDEVSNWAGGFMPLSTRDVIIPAGRPNYPSSSATVVGANKYLIIEPSAQATFGTLDMSSTATLWLKSSSYGATELIASLMVDFYETPMGTVKIELNLQGNGSMWHYISPPVTSVPATLFSSNGAGVTEYRENLISTDMNNGWVTSTGYHYDTSIPVPAWVNEGWTWTNLVAGRGYNYYSATNKVFTINGTPNTGDFNVTLAYNTKPTVPDHPTAQGWNLIGNPYTCGLDWDVVVAANAIWDDVEAAIYFRKNNLTYYYVDGSIVPGDYNAVGNFITPMQGFFIKTNTPAIDLLIPATARTHTASLRYKGASSSPHKGASSSRIRIQLENTSMSDQIVLSFNEQATLGFDNRFDARKLFPSSDKLSISSSLGGTEYAINSIPYPVNYVSVPLIINAVTTGSYTIKATEIQGLENYNVILVDKLQNESVNLSYTGSYSFNATAGISADRFVVTVSNILTSLPETTTSSKPFNIYSSGEMINIQTLSDSWNGEKGKIKILDMTGRTISVSNQMEFSKGDIISLPVNLTSGIYVVEINSGIKRFVGKVVVK